MKARFGTRLTLLIIAFVLLVFGVATLYVGIRLNGIALNRETVDLLKEIQEAEKPVIGGAGYWTVRRIIILAMGALQVVGSLLLFSIPGRMRYKRKDFIVQQTDNGEIRIAVKAVENLVNKCIDTHEEIHVNSLKVSNFRDGVVVDLKASMPNNISIPLSIESLQKQIKQYLTVSSGINVKEVRVDVNDTNETLTRESPYELRSETAEKPEKKSVHERVFEEEAPQEPVPEVPAPEQAPAPEAETPAEAVAETAQEVQDAAADTAEDVQDAAEDIKKAAQDASEELTAPFGGQEEQ